ncbi:hypothetical protein CLV71_103133 [Actinophytocola oryzae]|uniref:Uncharacterized protein n=1 Tax=Actinophytocola oryzae TaxID=502181 RepID=A0A4R7VY17_9PSEU|nr:hypothetical protein CLV71_103133 [Actinophytocola oryzae]
MTENEAQEARAELRGVQFEETDEQIEVVDVEEMTEEELA